MTDVMAKGLTVQVADACVLDDASFSFATGELVAILGPNGAGKSTLLRAMMGLIPVHSGDITIDGKSSLSMSPVERARLVSYLPQIRPLAWPITVRDTISLGRFAHGAALGRLSKLDAAAVDAAIESCDLAALAERHTESLSGGEIARVHFARAIAARTPLLVADEPVAALDPRHQLRIAGLLRNYVDEGGGALVVLHEVALAARYADRLVWMNKGRIVAIGTAAETLTAETLANVYGVAAHVRQDKFGFDVRVESAL